MRTTLVALLALLTTPALALDAKAASHLDHLGHMGFGRKLTRNEVARLPKAYTVARVGKEHHGKAHAKAHQPSARQAAERAGYKKVSELTKGAFPPFYAGIGVVYVRPETLPVGPFLAFDRKGSLSSTIYMLSLEEMNSHKKFEAVGTRRPKVDHVTVYYHGGHPGVDFPHYHYVLWHVSKKGEALVAK